MTDREKLQRLREATEEARAFMATSYDHRTISAAAMERIAAALLDVVDGAVALAAVPDGGQIAVRELGERIGYGRVMQLAEQLWSCDDPRGALSTGPCLAFLVPCPHSDPAGCEWCCGTGRVTAKVRDAMLGEVSPLAQRLAAREMPNLQAEPPAEDVRDSLQRFGTVTFARSYARQFFTFDRVAGRVDATVWFELVPEVYREAVTPLVAETFEFFRGRKFLPDSLDLFVARLCALIRERVEPVR